MFRRNLLRLLPLAPRDVDRPVEYGLNDDTQRKTNSTSNAKGSRPRARNAEPYTMTNPVPKPKFPLEREHYLTIYDVYTKIDPRLEVKAFITDKSIFSYDVLVLMNEEDATREHVDYLNREARHILANSAGIREAKLKALVEFFDKRELHIGYGMKNVTPELINETPDWAKRELLRSSLNYDWTKWEMSWSIWFKEVVDHLCAWSEYALDTPEMKLHRHYWAAQAFWGRKKLYTEGTELYHFVCDNHAMTIHDQLPHPILRFEDLHTCDVVLQLKEIVKTPESLIQIKQDKSMLSEEEIAYLRDVEQQTMIDYHKRLEDEKQKEKEIAEGKRKPGWIFY